MTARPALLDHTAIRHVLPQGHPMVLVDRVVALDPGVSIVGLKAITGSEPCYQHLPAGLPPARYAYPVSLLMESFGQAAALLWFSKHGELGRTGDFNLLMFAAARSCRFDGAAYPGDVLRHIVELEHVVADTAFATGQTWVGHRRIATFGNMAAVIRHSSVLDRVQR